MEVKENEVVSAERLNKIKEDVQKKAQYKREHPDYIEETKLVLLVLVDAAVQEFGSALPSWTINWDIGYKPRRFFAISKQVGGQILVHVVRRGLAKGAWIKIEDLDVEDCWAINDILNNVGTPSIKLLE